MIKRFVGDLSVSAANRLEVALDEMFPDDAYVQEVVVALTASTLRRRVPFWYIRNAAYADQDFRGDDNQMNLQILKNEFEAGNGSFLITIRANMIWDVDAFDRLSNAMEQYCREASGKSAQLERWLAQGFWYVPNFVRGWTSHPNFQRALPATYYESAYRQLDELAFWFFFGYCGDQNDPTCPAPVG